MIDDRVDWSTVESIHVSMKHVIRITMDVGALWCRMMDDNNGWSIAKGLHTSMKWVLGILREVGVTLPTSLTIGVKIMME